MCACFREPCSHFEICTIAVTLLVGMGRRTEWQASWGEVVDSKGDKYGEYLVKLDEKDVKCRYRVVFLTGSALKVLSAGDGKIPNKKVKVRVCHREYVKF